MARMIPLDPAVTVGLDDGWSLLATEAGRYAAGLIATISLMNGTMQACETIPLTDGTQREVFATLVSCRAHATPSVIEGKLLELLNAIEGVLRQKAAEANEERQSQATRLVELAISNGVELFHTPEHEPHATIPVEGHMETWPLRVKGFRRWLARLFYEEEEKAPGAQSLQDALGVLEAKACFDGQEHPVFIRLATHQDALYLDLGNDTWQCVESTAAGWRVLHEAPVKFRRSRGVLPLSTPTPGDDLELLRRFINIGSEEDWRLLVSWLLAALRPAGPYPVLVIHAEQGAGKSTLCRILRSLTDPNTANLRTTPRDERDLIIAANNGWLIALDNLSHLPDWLSDALCRLATGSGFATRELYSDAEEAIFAAQRPIVLNGIEELATRGDLLDRSIILYLPTIPEEKRQDEEVFWSDFEAARPKIFGALLDIVCKGLAQMPSVKLDNTPRMADFAKWACAVAPACGWTQEDFLKAYKEKRAASHDLVLEASSVAGVLRTLLDGTPNTPWRGTASELLIALEQKAGGDLVKQKTWPKNGRSLSNTLRRLAPTLRAVGITVAFGDRTGKQGTRVINIAMTPSAEPTTGTHAGRVQGTI